MARSSAEMGSPALPGACGGAGASNAVVSPGSTSGGAASPRNPTILLVDLGSTGTLGRELAAALGDQWEVISPQATQASLLPLPDAAAAAFLVVDRPSAGCVAAWGLELRRRQPELPLLIAAGEGAPQELAQLLKAGICDFVLRPFRACEVQARLLRLHADRHPEHLVERLKAKLGLKSFVGQSPAFVAAVERISSIAACDANVVITGETGTGKEVFARAIHHVSDRSGHPFIPVDCGAIPLDLVENELFGHEAEAFTGAAHSRRGLIREAEGGTLFLDEIDALPASSQVKLLRFLQDKEYRVLGSTQMRRADVRLIAATNARVEEEVERGRLRRDLYYRINVLPLALPPLRERGGDVLLLVRHFLARHSVESGRPPPQITAGARQALLEYDWPGNVRELEHLVHRAVLLAADSHWIDRAEIQLPEVDGREPALGSFQRAKRAAVADFERRYIERLLLAHDGNISRAARAAGKNRRALFELIRKYSIDARRFRETGAQRPSAEARRRAMTI